MPRTQPPVVIIDGSFKIEVDEPVDIDPEPCEREALRRFKYMRRSSKSNNKNIRYVVVKRNGREIWSEEFDPKECQIEIYWEKPRMDSQDTRDYDAKAQ